MEVQIWIKLEDLERLVKAADWPQVGSTEIFYTIAQQSADQICVNLNTNSFIGLQDRDVLVKID